MAFLKIQKTLIALDAIESIGLRPKDNRVIVVTRSGNEYISSQSLNFTDADAAIAAIKAAIVTDTDTEI